LKAFGRGPERELDAGAGLSGGRLPCYGALVMREPLAFHKYEGLGNDFLVVETWDPEYVSPALASRLCDRHFGVGGDGVLLVLPPDTSQAGARMPRASEADARMPRASVADARMIIINSDGSIPEMCGNGVRCVAVHVARSRGLLGGVVRIQTAAGVRECTVEDTSREGLVTVDMGKARVGEEREVEVDGDRVSLTMADVGNPHAVAFGAFERDAVERLGARIAVHPLFPGGTNVEFACVKSGEIDLVVWERGVGITLACGTGACAAAAVACAKGYVPYGAAMGVRLPGGVLQVSVEKNGNTTMRGPARHVFSGTTDTGASL
jgi:diaminopimelate epimerase